MDGGIGGGGGAGGWVMWSFGDAGLLLVLTVPLDTWQAFLTPPGVDFP